MVAIDSDVLLIEFAFHRDQRFAVNAQFLAVIRNQGAAITIYNVMEILGQLSFNLSSSKLEKWRAWLQSDYNLSLLWPNAAGQPADLFFHQEIYALPLMRMRARRIAFLDALIINLAERAGTIDTLVTWNARHFRDKTSLKVLTPAEYIAS